MRYNNYLSTLFSLRLAKLAPNTIRLAPMMGYTNAPFRLLIRLLSPNTQLFTEMVTVNAIIHNPQQHYLFHFKEEDNVVLQLGGCEVGAMLEVAKIAQQQGFKEININCGCPSNRVQKGHFGACLMARPQLVAEMVAAIKQQTQLCVSVKHRLGLDNNTSYQPLYEFARQCLLAGADSLIVHARNAWLAGLSPRQNRHVPTLQPTTVKRLKADFSEADICFNGEIRNARQALYYLQNHYCNAVMIGRQGWDNPCLFYELEKLLYTPLAHLSRSSVLQRYFQIVSESSYAQAQNLAKRHDLRYWLKPLVNLFHGCYGAKLWRQNVSTMALPWQQSMAKLLELAIAFESKDAQRKMQSPINL